MLSDRGSHWSEQVPVAFILSYAGVRVLLTFRRKKRLKRTDAAAALFQDLDVGRSGVITADQLHAALTSFGLRLSEERVKEVMTSANPRVHGSLDLEEFVAWIQRNVSRAKVRLLLFSRHHAAK